MSKTLKELFRGWGGKSPEDERGRVMPGGRLEKPARRNASDGKSAGEDVARARKGQEL